MSDSLAESREILERALQGPGKGHTGDTARELAIVLATIRQAQALEQIAEHLRNIDLQLAGGISPDVRR